MSGKKKYSTEFKLSVVREYFEGRSGGVKALAAKYQIPPAPLRRWIKIYEFGGVEALANSRQTYSGDFKIGVVEYMHQNSMSITMTAAYFGIKSDMTVARWERLYYEQGKESLYAERRGRSKTMPRKKKPVRDINVNEDLLAEVQRLRMENEYLKKLNALIQEKEKAEQQKK